MKIKGVIFDMDGVLFDSESFCRSFMQNTFKKYNYPWNDAFFISLIGVNRATGLRLAGEFIGDEEKAKQVLAEYRTDMDKAIFAQGIPFKKGAMEIIQFLKKRNIPISLATSSPLDRAHILFEGNHTEFPFEVVITGDQVINSKPDPEIFLKAAKAMDLDIHDCMIIEDSHNGMKAAIASGAISCMVPDLLPITPFIQEYADYIFEDLCQVQQFIEKSI